MLPVLALNVLVSLGSTPCPPGKPLEGGQHQRLATRAGPVHLWCRTGGEPKGVVLYAHGYFDDVDSAFDGHRLAAQFAASGIDALFVAVEAPSGPRQPVFFDDLGALLSLLSAHVGQLPDALLVVGHSGGNRTLKAWLESGRVDEVALLDGFYGDAAPWARWLAQKPHASLRLVGQHTWDRAEAWRASLAVPQRLQVTHERARCSHMQLVTAGDWLPRVIRESSLGATAVAVGG